MTTIPSTGNYISLAAIIVGIASYFGFVIAQNDVLTILVGLITLYGVIHQIVVTKTANTAGLQTGVFKAKK